MEQLGIKGITNILMPEEFWKQNNIWQQRFAITQGLPPKTKAPHITLLDPISSLDRFSKAAKSFKEAIGDMEPFTITLKKFKYFTHKKRGFTLYLVPNVSKDCEGHNPLYKLQKKLWNACKDIKFLQNKMPPNKFTPHISLGKLATEEELQKTLAQFSKNWKPITFTVKEIYIMSKQLHDTVVRHVIPLGKFSTKAHFEPILFPPAPQASININHVPMQTTKEQLQNVFKSFEVITVSVVFKTIKKQNYTKGWGNVVFKSQQDRDKALEEKFFIGDQRLELFPCD